MRVTWRTPDLGWSAGLKPGEFQRPCGVVLRSYPRVVLRGVCKLRRPKPYETWELNCASMAETITRSWPEYQYGWEVEITTPMTPDLGNVLFNPAISAPLAAYQTVRIGFNRTPGVLIEGRAGILDVQMTTGLATYFRPDDPAPEWPLARFTLDGEGEFRRLRLIYNA